MLYECQAGQVVQQGIVIARISEMEGPLRPAKRTKQDDSDDAYMYVPPPEREEEDDDDDDVNEQPQEKSTGTGDAAALQRAALMAERPAPKESVIMGWRQTVIHTLARGALTRAEVEARCRESVDELYLSGVVDSVAEEQADGRVALADRADVWAEVDVSDPGLSAEHRAQIEAHQKKWGVLQTDRVSPGAAGMDREEREGLEKHYRRCQRTLSEHKKQFRVAYRYLQDQQTADAAQTVLDMYDKAKGAMEELVEEARQIRQLLQGTGTAS